MDKVFNYLNMQREDATKLEKHVSLLKLQQFIEILVRRRKIIGSIG